MAAYKETQLIEKLNNHNYANWKFKISMILIKDELFDCITNEPPNPVTAEWSKRDNRARALINLFIDDSQIIHVRNLLTARDTWNALKAIHERTNLSSKLYLLRKLYSIKLDERGSMSSHISNILETVEKLKAIGENISPSHISALLLCSLPSSYDPLITALEAKNEDELTPEFIANKLTDESNRRREHSDNHASTTRAFHAKKGYINNQGFKNANYRNEKFCTYCKRTNHDKNSCWHLKNKNSNANKYKNNLQRDKRNSSSLCFETRQNKQDYTHQEEVNDAASKIKNLAFLASKSNKSTWLIDSGSSSHISNNKDLFIEIHDTERTQVMIANGKSLNSFGSGNIVLNTVTSDGIINEIILKNVLYVPDIESNLISVRKATENGCKLIFEKENCKLTYAGKTYLEGKIVNNLYEVNLIENVNINQAHLVQECNNQNCLDLWHKRLGHKNYDSVKEIRKRELATGIMINNCKHATHCNVCIKSKMSDTPYPKVAKNRAQSVGEVIHSDVCGPVTTPSIGGKTYILTFTDDFSRYTHIYLLSRKNEVYTKLKEYVTLLTNKFNKKPQILRSDNGGEYANKDIDNYLSEMGIERQFSTPHSPSQNGVSERKNRTLMETTRCLLSEANLPQTFWGEAINTANYLINRLPTKANNKTPYELWNGRKPDMSHLKVFGCRAYSYVHKIKRNKLDDKAEAGTFVGYDPHSKAYRIYIEGKNVIISRSVKFVENEFPYATVKNEQVSNPSIEEKPETLEIEFNNTLNTLQNTSDSTDIIEPRRSDRNNKGVPPDRFAYITQHKAVYEPKDYQDAIAIENPVEKQNWLKAMDDEIKSLKQNGTWTLIAPPQGRKVIGSKWTYKVKYDNKGEIQAYKARLVAKGFSQKYGVDYEETFAPVVTHTTIRTFLAAASHKNLIVNHVDVKTAFLHGDLNEDVYMKQPEGYEAPGKENEVCKLSKAIYGLKQAAHAWNVKIADILRNMGFVQSTADSCLFINRKNENKIYIIMYVDDILIAAKDYQIKQIIEQLKKNLEIKNLGEVKHYLGISIRKTNDGSFALNQKLKIEELANKFSLDQSRPCDTPMETSYIKLDDNDNLLPNNTKYRQAIGAMLYIATFTRPDISASVNILSRRNEAPRSKDWNQVKRIIRYLNSTKDLELIINPGTKAILTCYADADWAGDKVDRKSTSGNLFLLGKSPIQWISKKQTCVAASSAEAEYISAANAAQEIQHLITLLQDLDMPQTLPIKLFDDNQSTIKMIESAKCTNRTKHIDVKYHIIKDLKEKGILDLQYCPTKSMTADVFTKPLPKPDFTKHRTALQLYPSSHSGIKGD